MSEKVFCLRRYFGGRYFGGRYFVREDILAEGILSEKVFRRRRYFVLEGIMSGYRIFQNIQGILKKPQGLLKKSGKDTLTKAQSILIMRRCHEINHK